MTIPVNVAAGDLLRIRLVHHSSLFRGYNKPNAWDLPPFPEVLRKDLFYIERLLPPRHGLAWCHDLRQNCGGENNNDSHNSFEMKFHDA
jgi:hypothetical protein